VRDDATRSRGVRRTSVLAILSFASLVVVALAIYAGIGLFPGHSQLHGMFIQLTVGAVTLILATYKAFTGRLFATSWWKELDEELVRRGFHRATPAEQMHTARIHVQLTSPNVVRMDKGGSIDHVMVGRIDGFEVRAFRVRLRGGLHWIDAPAVAVRLPAAFAPATIRRVRRGLRPVGMKRSFFELGSFNRTVDVRSADPYFASALIDPRMIAWLNENLRRSVIEVADGWAVAWSTSLLGAMRSPQDLLDLLVRFNVRIPRFVPSLFPPSTSDTTWVHPRPHPGVSALIDRLNDGPPGR
jgi:hypothetical protein